MNTQGMSYGDGTVGKSVQEQRDAIPPMKVNKMNLISDALKVELKEIINEVLDEREYKKRVNGSHDNYKEPTASDFEAENFRHFVGDEEPNYESWEQPWD